MTDFAVKDSGERAEFDSGMVRDTADEKVLYSLIFDGPLVERYAEHLTKGARKYEPRNWMKARTEEELERFEDSATRHFIQWLRGDTDEDHFAAVVFNMNGAEYVKARMLIDGPADYTEEAEAMLDDPTFNDPVDVSPEPIYHPGDVVRLSDQRLYYRDLNGYAVALETTVGLPEVVTLTYIAPPYEPAWWIKEEVGVYIVEEQILGVVGVDNSLVPKDDESLTDSSPADHSDSYLYSEPVDLPFETVEAKIS